MPLPATTFPPLLELSLLDPLNPFSLSIHLLSSTSLSLEARAKSGSGLKHEVWETEFRSFANGRKAPPFLCLVSNASLGLLTLKLVSASDLGNVEGCCLFASPAGLHSCADTIQLALSEMLAGFCSDPSKLECFSGINSSRTGLVP